MGGDKETTMIRFTLRDETYIDCCAARQGRYTAGPTCFCGSKSSLKCTLTQELSKIEAATTRSVIIKAFGIIPCAA